MGSGYGTLRPRFVQAKYAANAVGGIRTWEYEECKKAPILAGESSDEFLKNAVMERVRRINDGFDHEKRRGG